MTPTKPTAEPTLTDVEWLHRFINAVPFGEHAPIEDIDRAHLIVRDLSTALSAPVREGWIPVSERLPKIGDPKYDGPCDGTKVLFLHDGDVFTGWPVEPPDHWETTDGAQAFGVTHWMPLPAARKEGKG